MIYAAKILADGQLALAKGTIFTAQADAVIKSVILVNSNVASANVNLYLKRKDGTSRRIMPMDMIFPTRYQFETFPEFSIQSEDEIEGDSTVAGVDYSVVGGSFP